MNRDLVVKKINNLLSSTGSSINKYYRNYALYNQTSVADIKSANPVAPGVIQNGMKINSDYPSINVIKSCIDSVVNSIATAKPRPFINTMKGSFKTIEIARQLQIFFDFYFYEQDLYNKNVIALRDACLFDRGYVYIDEITLDVSNISPWNIYTDPNEKDKKQVYIIFNNATIESLPEAVEKELTKAELNLTHVTYGLYYNSKYHVKALTVNGSVRKIYNYEADSIPVKSISYTPVIVGDHCLSIADMLLGLQKEINILSKTIALAAKKNPAQTILLQNASNIAVGEINNEIGNIIQYNAENNGGNPVNILTPSFISEQYESIRNKDIQRAYELVGKSQTSASGRKEVGIESGVAIATLADLQSERFQLLLSSFIDMFTQEAKLVTEIGMSNATIITPSRYELKLTWNEVREDYSKMRIEFSSADALSKDPSEKLKQLQSLAQAGIIPATQIPSLLEIPDINRGFSAVNNGYNCAMALIDACIYDDKYELPFYVPFELLKEMIVNTMLSLKAAEGATDDNEADIEKLSKLFKIVMEKQRSLDSIQEETSNISVNGNNAYSMVGGVENNPQVANPYDTGMSANSNVSAGTDAIV